jgi:hypothetical protein
MSNPCPTILQLIAIHYLTILTEYVQWNTEAPQSTLSEYTLQHKFTEACEVCCFEYGLNSQVEAILMKRWGLNAHALALIYRLGKGEAWGDVLDLVRQLPATFSSASRARHRRTLFPSVASQAFDVAQTLYKKLPKNGDLAHWFLKSKCLRWAGFLCNIPDCTLPFPSELFFDSENPGIYSFPCFSWWKLHNTPAEGS